MRPTRIAFGTDERGPMTDAVKTWLADQGHEITVVVEDEVWTDVGDRVGRAVADGGADVGVVWCWTGTGVSIAANKVEGVRAALCTDAETARGARRWNDANVLAMSLRLVSEEVAREMVGAFLETGPDPDELGTIARLR